jgi:hypothetical protein
MHILRFQLSLWYADYLLAMGPVQQTAHTNIKQCAKMSGSQKGDCAAEA